jgi:DNA-binding NarL/FixJ family response regulator
MVKVKNTTVFILEENEEYSFMLDYIISRDNDCHIVRFNSREQFLNSLDQNPGLIILDDPASALTTLREIKNRLPDSHVVILADKEDIEMATRFIMEGAEDYLLKKKEVLNQIRDIVDTVFHTR